MTQKNYSQLKKQLDELISRLEDGEHDIDEAIKLYGQTQKIVVEMEDYLKKSEAKIKQL